MSLQQAREPQYTFVDSMQESGDQLYDNYPATLMPQDFDSNGQEFFAFNNGANDASISDTLFTTDDFLDFTGGQQNPVDTFESGA